jgi:hypothetical protein
MQAEASGNGKNGKGRNTNGRGGRFARVAVAGAALAAAAASARAAEPETKKTYAFDGDRPGKPPAGFSFGRTKNIGRAGRWVVQAAKDAPSGGRVLAQLDKDKTSGRFAVAVAAADAPGDVRLAVKCKAVSGEVDQTCGLVFRYRDQNNYYLARSNALEGNVRLYHVRDGKRAQIGTWDGQVPAGAWIDLAVTAKGEALTVHFNGQKVIEGKDGAFTGGGKVGLWIKADSVTLFDDLTVSAP